MRLFLAAHGGSYVLVRIIKACFLAYFAAVFQDVFLAADLAGYGPGHVAEGIDILELGTGAQLCIALAPDGDVGIAAEASFFHVAVADAKIGHDAVEGLEVGHCLLGRAHVRLGDNFHQGRACPVQVNVAVIVGLGMDVLAGIIFHMDTGDAYLFRSLSCLNHEVPVLAQGKLELGDLVAAGQIGIEIVLSGKNGVQVDGTVGSQTHQCRKMHGLMVYSGQGPGHACAHLAGVGVRLFSEAVGTLAEKL